MDLEKLKNEVQEDNSIYFEMPSEKIVLLIKALSLGSTDSDIKDGELFIPDGCEKHGFVEGNHNLGNPLHFLADMLEI